MFQSKLIFISLIKYLIIIPIFNRNLSNNQLQSFPSFLGNLKNINCLLVLNIYLSIIYLLFT